MFYVFQFPQVCETTNIINEFQESPTYSKTCWFS